MLSDRKGKELSSGGDTEFCYIIYLLGYKWKYDTSLFLKHFIPADRMNKKYLSDIYFGFGKANAIIEWYYGNGDMNRITNKVSWWKVYIKQVLFYKIVALICCFLSKFSDFLSKFFEFFSLN